MLKRIIKLDKEFLYPSTYTLRLYRLLRPKRVISTRDAEGVRSYCQQPDHKGVYFKMCSNLCQALLLSSSNCYGYSMLEFAKEEICSFLKQKNVEEIIFLPYAQNDYDGYTAKVKKVIEPWGFKVSGSHTYTDPKSLLLCSKAIFVGGGNTFLLLKRLYDLEILTLIRKRVQLGHLLYIGSSAGTNVATRSIHTTNDMPITYPPTFDAIGLVPFNINPHYVDSVSETHKGETRDQRIGEYLEMNYAAPVAVVGLREGSILRVDGTSLSITGVAGAVLFRKGSKKAEFPIGSDLSFLLRAGKSCNVKFYEDL